MLQRIGFCYFAAWAAKRRLGPRGQAFLATALLVGYWAAMTHVVGPEGYAPGLEPRTNLSAQVDRIVLGGHLYHWTKYWDPEGVLSTLPSVATALLGLLAGEWLRSGAEPKKKALGFLAGGLVAFGLGILWGEAAPSWLLFPVNKNLWSPSFVLLTGGLASVLFGLTWWLVDVRGLRAWTGPFVSYGRNAIAVYVGSEVLAGVVTLNWAGPSGPSQNLQEGALRGRVRELASPHAGGFGLRARQRAAVVGRRLVDGPARPLRQGLIGRHCLITEPSRRRISPQPPFSRARSPVSPWPKGYFAAARSSTSMPQPGASLA